MTDYLYRFRSLRSLIDYEELAKTYIFFPSPEKLNDPLEGFREVVWSGDKVVWQNLFKHYFLSLVKRSVAYLLKEDLNDANFPIHASLDDVQGESLPAIKEALAIYLNNSNIVEHIQVLADQQRPVVEEELRFHLRGVHTYTLKLVTQLMIDLEMLVGAQNISRVSDEEALKVSSLILSYMRQPALRGGTVNLALRTGLARIESELLIMNYQEWKLEKQRNWSRLSTLFADDYVKNVKRLCSEDWFVACFMGSPYNSSIWGTYGENHSAVCLKFKFPTRNGIPVLPLEDERRRTKFQLDIEKVNYNSRPPKLPFFTSIGCYNERKLTEDWFTGLDGEVSTLAVEILGNHDEWRKKYWEDHKLSITTKLQAWAGEDEFRASLYSMFEVYENDDSRKLRYDFNDLDGIIFGIKTTEENKFKLIEIVNKLCDETGREGFTFYQAYHDVDKSSIAYRPILTVSASVKE